jgi:hypothetical protein
MGGSRQAGRAGPYDDAEFLRIGADDGFLGFDGTLAAASVKEAGKASLLFGAASSGAYDRVFVPGPESGGVLRYFGIKGRELWKGEVRRK